jgi:hypothetical protein
MKAGDRVTLRQLEIEHIRRVLENTDEISEAAEWLGIDRGTLRKKIERHRIQYVKRPRRQPAETDQLSEGQAWANVRRSDDAETSTDD